MQPLTAAPRTSLTFAQVNSILTTPALTVEAGLELLSTTNALVGDYSDVLKDGKVERKNYADVHGTCRLELTEQFVWGKDRVRPYMTLTDGVTGLSARFNLGVYVLTSPVTPRGETPVTYDVDGQDLLYLLATSGPGDTYVVASGTTYLSAVNAALTASGVGVPVYLDGTLATTQVPTPMVWAIAPDLNPSWLRIINDLLAQINYRGLWADQDGNFRSGPYVAPSSRVVEWVFDTADSQTNLVGSEREMSADRWGAPNYWRFVRKAMTATPAEGSGIYTVQDAVNQAEVGRTIKKVEYLDAADQTSLVAQGNMIVANDRQATRTFTISVDPLPIAGHFDIVRLVDAGRSDKCQVSSWELPLSGQPGKWELEATQ